MFATILWIRERVWAGYLVAAISCAAALLVRFAAGQHLAGAPFITFVPAILLTSIAGGIAPGLLCTAASALLGNYFFINPSNIFLLWSKGWVAVLAFCVFSSIFVILLNTTMVANFRLIRAMKLLRIINGTLESRIAERTAELVAAREQLHQSQKMEAIGQLTGGIAHDFNNLLTGIAGSLEILQRKLPEGRPGELQRYVDTARDSTARAASLTHRLLAFARRQSLEPKITDINALAQGMEDLIRRTIDRGNNLTFALAPGLSTAFVDPGQLELALLNLCINASDAMPAGGNLTIKTENHALDAATARALGLAAGEYELLSVTDNGTGMSQDVAERAFDPFFTTKPVGQGTGLGLSMVSGFVRQSGGQVKIHSAPGRGTSVCLYFPRASARPQAEQTQFKSETVLVVEHDAAARLPIVEALAKLGYTALQAPDGPAALEILQSATRIDLLITDVGLPNSMNGRQLAEAAQQLHPALKILFLTGYADNTLIRQIILPPGMHVLSKPFVPAALTAHIEKLLAPA